MRFVPAILSALAALALQPAQLPAAAAGFDCSRAGTATEKAICADPVLSDADSRLSVAYAGALKAASGAARDALVQEQRAWLRARNACGAETDCLAAQYGDRLAALGPQAQVPAQAAAPAAPSRDGFAALTAEEWAMAMARAAQAGTSCDTPLQLEEVTVATPWPAPCPYIFAGPDERATWRYTVEAVRRIPLGEVDLYLLEVEYYGARLNRWSELYLVRADGRNGTVATASSLALDRGEDDAALFTLTLVDDLPASPGFGSVKGSRFLRATAEGIAPAGQ